MDGLEITCCEFCQKWFDIEDLKLEAYDYEKEYHMSFCPDCSKRLLKQIDKMKKDIYGHKEKNNE